MSPNPLAGVDRILLPLYYQYYSTGGTVLPVLPYRTFGFDCMIVFQDEAIFRRVDLASTKIARGIRICGLDSLSNDRLRTCRLFLDDVQNLDIHAVRAKILMSFFCMNM